MKDKKTKILLKTDNWKFKTRSEGRRMKIYIKLNKEETARWKMLRGAVIGESGSVGDDEFAKIMLFRGLNAFMDDVNSALDEMSDEEKDEILKEAGLETEIEIVVPTGESDENSDDTDEISGEGSESSSEEQED
jgi:hypothetical protein